MAIFVHSNTSSLMGRRNLDNVQKQLDTTYQRLSSGKRINSSKDDAAGLQISDRLTTQINGLNQGNRNASDAIALSQTIESGIDEITSMLQRMRTLAVQASNGTNTLEDHQALNKEASALSSEITRIAEQTTFGGKKVLSGTVLATDTNNDTIYNVADASITDPNEAARSGTVRFQVGANKGDTVELTVQNFVLSFLADESLSTAVMTELKKAPAAGKGVTAGGLIKTADAAGTAGKLRFSLSSAQNAQDAIESIDLILQTVDSQRGNLGAIQNRLESSIRNQSNVSANQADARSRISDTDFAHESSQLAVQTIVEQASNAMLIHANSTPKLAATLLNL